MHIYLNNPAEFHPDPIWNDWALGFFEERHHDKNNNNKMSSDMGSVPHPKPIVCMCVCLQIVVAQGSERFCVIQKFIITASANSKKNFAIWLLIDF